jgi:hypothetical protein
MSKPLVVSIPHSLGKEEAVRRLKAGLAGALSASPILKFDQQTWSGDSLRFRASALGPVATGTVDVGDDQVRLEVTLPWLLQRFAEKVQSTFAQRTRVLLQKK